MTKQEWAGICADIQAIWPNTELRPATVAAWYEDVAELGEPEIRAALTSFRAKEFPPNGGMLRERALEIGGQALAPDPDRAFELVNEAIRRHGGDVGTYLGDGRDAEPASVTREKWLAERDPIAAEVARIVGWDYLRGAGPDAYHEPSVRRAFRDSYEAELKRERTRRDVAALGTGSAPRRIGEIIAGAAA